MNTKSINTRNSTSIKPKVDWIALSKNISEWEHAQKNIYKSFETDEEKNSKKVVSAILSGIFANTDKSLSINNETQIIKRLVKSIVEAKTENILTEAEAEVIIALIASKFVERRLEDMMKNVFSSKNTINFAFHGSLKHTF